MFEQSGLMVSGGQSYILLHILLCLLYLANRPSNPVYQRSYRPLHAPHIRSYYYLSKIDPHLCLLIIPSPSPVILNNIGHEHVLHLFVQLQSNVQGFNFAGFSCTEDHVMCYSAADEVRLLLSVKFFC